MELRIPVFLIVKLVLVEISLFLENLLISGFQIIQQQVIFSSVRKILHVIVLIVLVILRKKVSYPSPEIPTIHQYCTYSNFRRSNCRRRSICIQRFWIYYSFWRYSYSSVLLRQRRNWIVPVCWNCTRVSYKGNIRSFPGTITRLLSGGLQRVLPGIQPKEQFYTISEDLQKLASNGNMYMLVSVKSIFLELRKPRSRENFQVKGQSVLFRLSGELLYPDVRFIPHYRGGGTISILGSSHNKLVKDYEGSGSLFGLASGLRKW